jgi:membrane-bound lytic murein transglycosylase B
MLFRISSKRMTACAVAAALAVFALTQASLAAQASDMTFGNWLKGVRTEARQKGVSDAIIARALPDTLAPVQRIIDLDRKQPEGTTTFEQYLDRVVSPDRVDRGQTRMLNSRALLNKVGETYGVDPTIVVALWGVETNYGKITGGYDVVTALATLAYDGRRSDYFRGELMKALQVLDEGHIGHADMTGSWAGAMGQVQFMPSSFLRFAQDFNGDGQRDIWTTPADVFASAANYLAQSGWQKGQPWGQRVQVPASVERGLMGVDNTYPVSFWQARGLRKADGSPLDMPLETKASLIQPDGPGTTAFLVYDNFKVLLKWNRSSYFATAVCLLADRLKGAAR